MARTTTLPVAQKPLTNNVYIDGILWGGKYYSSSGSSVTRIDYSFWNSTAASFDDPYKNKATNPNDWFPEGKDSLIKALDAWAAVANIQFVDAGDNKESATLGFYNLNNADLGDYLFGEFSPPGENGQGIGYFNREALGGNVAGAPGTLNFAVLIHELGHGLGLAHPHDNGGGSPIYPGVTSPFRSLGNLGLNQGIYTTMSYNSGFYSQNGNQEKLGYGLESTPMAFDIAAIQYLYGPNNSYKTGNDTYYLPSVNQSGTSYSCIWDAGGVDTINGISAQSDVTIDLNDASLNTAQDGAGAGGYVSSAKGIFGGFTIANSVVIENATGSNFNDQIIGNEFSNSLVGNDGNDTIDGGAGSDTINGGNGNDRLIGRAGSDRLTGGTGNDVLIGGAGNDVLLGGTGADRFLYDTEGAFARADVGQDTISDFNRSQGDKIVLDRTTFTVLSSTSGNSLAANDFAIAGLDILGIPLTGELLNAKIVYNSTNGSLYYNQNGTAVGFGSGGLFATLSNEPTLAASDFIVQA
ncbi:M10 family metallopeptidase [Nostoc punctiforme]|uniref:Hemolysin-type calcium-binding region n=1 Tax=Nostoc punctiforme (strain ATCC 29133 / PCC 73102) TaxID=63737 RepID=B2IWX2_NOSP7|nr:M10 family metallopeptidase [Nostoc punctiforme]ACC82978.1 Hemolysin-type calcium-binding region [Nostoc punctiforme PCC 73102]